MQFKQQRRKVLSLVSMLNGFGLKNLQASRGSANKLQTAEMESECS